MFSNRGFTPIMVIICRLAFGLLLPYETSLAGTPGPRPAAAHAPSFAGLPLAFEPNQGQFQSAARRSLPAEHYVLGGLVEQKRDVGHRGLLGRPHWSRGWGGQRKRKTCRLSGTGRAPVLAISSVANKRLQSSGARLFVAILLGHAFAETPPRFVCLCRLDDGRQVRFCSTPTKVFAWHARCPWSGRHCRICFRPY